MQFTQQNPALLLIDIQKGFENEEFWGGNKNNPEVEKMCHTILEKWRSLSLPLFHIQHSSLNKNSLLHPNNPGFEFSDYTQPKVNEPVFVKHVNSAFIGTHLEKTLKDQHIDTLVIIGLTTNHCVSTTSRMAGNLGFNTFVVSDATACFDRKGVNGEVFNSELIHQTSLANLSEEFATILTTEQLFSKLSN